MANACIAYRNFVDADALITATSSNLLLPVSNITNPHIARKWRGTTTGGDSIVIDAGEPITFDTIAVLGITGNLISINASLVDSSGAAGEVASHPSMTVDQTYKTQVSLESTPRVARYFRVDLTATNYAEVGRIFIGARTQFSYNFVKGWSRSYSDLSSRSKTRGGQTQVFPDSVYRTIDVTFDFLTQSDRDGFVEDIDRTNALKTDVLFITNPDSGNLARDSVWGLMTSLTPVVQPSVSTFTKQYTIEERL